MSYEILKVLAPLFFFSCSFVFSTVDYASKDFDWTKDLWRFLPSRRLRCGRCRCVAWFRERPRGESAPVLPILMQIRAENMISMMTKRRCSAFHRPTAPPRKWNTLHFCPETTCSYMRHLTQVSLTENSDCGNHSAEWLHICGSPKQIKYQFQITETHFWNNKLWVSTGTGRNMGWVPSVATF